MSSSINYGSLDVGALQFTDILESETDSGSGIVIPFSTLPATFTNYSFGSNPQYSGVGWTNFSSGVAGTAAGTAVSQVLTFTYNLSAGVGGSILGFQSLVILDTLSGSDASLTASETITNGSNTATLANYAWTVSSGSTGQWLSTPTADVNVTVQVTSSIAADAAGSAGEAAIISGIQQGFVYGSVTIDKQVSVDGGKTWLDVGNGNTSDSATSLVGCPVEYRVLVTNDSSSGLSFTGGVTDVGGPNFTFGGASSLTLASGATTISDISTIDSSAGAQYDTATVTGTVTDGNGHSASVTASDIALYTGVNGSVTIDKQVSVDGGNTWQDVGNGVLQDPSVLEGGTVEYRVVLDNTGTVALDNIAVSDSLAPGSVGTPPSGFTFSTSDPAGTLAIGQIVTSDIATAIAAPGHNLDVATLTVNAVIQDGTTTTNSICSITATDTADYTGITTNGPNTNITVDKQVYMCGTWVEVGAFNGLNVPTVLANGTADVQFRVVVTDNGPLAVSGLSVSDTYAGGTGTFVLPSTSLSVGQSVTSSILSLVAQVGTDITDTANASGTVSSGGITASVTANDTADYTGVTASVTIDKQVSVNGGTTWQDVGNGVLNDPTIAAGGTVEFRVLVTDTGGLAITNTSVSDAYSGGTATFVFGSSSLSTTGIAVGATVTSDVLSLTALSGHQLDTASVTGTVSDSCGNTSTVTSSDVADYTGTVTSTGSISIDKQVSVNCGKTWVDIGNGVLNDPTATIGGMIEYRVIVTDSGTTGLSNITVGDANGGAVTGFTFGGVSSIATLSAGQSVTSDAGLTPAIAGHQLDVATATGTVTGGSVTVQATDTADYTGVKGNITIDKQVSLNGCNWYDVGSGVLQDPTTLTGSEVYYRVIVTNTGSSTISGVNVTDTGNGAPSGFTFGSNSNGCGSGWGCGSNSGNVTITGGQSITSNVVGVCALVGYNTDTATVTGTITTGNGCYGGTTTTVGACDVADYTGVSGSITVEKLVSVNGGTSWEQYSSSNPPVALVGSSVEFQVVVTNTGSTTVSGISVSDTGGGSVTGFNFGTSDSSTITLAAGASATSDIASTAALCGVNTDTAYATGTITVGSGTATVTASSKADYQGTAGSISVDKQVSVNGGQTWQDVGNCYNDPTASVGSTVDFRVIVTDTGSTALTNVSVSDTGNTINNFTFGGKATLGSLTVGQSVTSDIATTKALSGYQVDTADATGTVSLNGTTATVSALDTADYTGGSSSNCGSGWGGSGGCGGGWGSSGSSGGSTSNGYGCGSSSSGNLCSEYGQAQGIQFCYSASDCVSQQGLQSGLACVSGHDGCSNAFVEVTNCANAYQSGAQNYFEGTVCNGQDFLASCGNGGSISGDLYIHVFSSAQAFSQHQSACQTDTYVGGGSQQVCLGDQVGCATVVGYVGHSGSYCA